MPAKSTRVMANHVPHTINRLARSGGCTLNAVSNEDLGSIGLASASLGYRVPSAAAGRQKRSGLSHKHNTKERVLSNNVRFKVDSYLSQTSRSFEEYFPEVN